MIFAVIMFIVGLVLLIKGGDWFVEGATCIAKRFHIPELLIGATVVSIGTTLPEVMVSATSAAKGLGDMAYGNAIGSIICNTALIAAITIAIKPAKVEKKSLIVPVGFFFIAAVIYSVTACVSQYFSRIFGFSMLAIFVVYMVFTVSKALKDAALKKSDSNDIPDATEEKPLWNDILSLVAGAITIAFGADLLVNNGTFIAKSMGVPASVIALTFVALGTSLPELVTAITSLIKGHGALSLGNIIGANLFNLVLVSGISMSIAPFSLPAEKLLAGMNASIVVDLPVMFGVMLLLTMPALIKGKLMRFQGIALLLIYFTYVAFQFVS